MIHILFNKSSIVMLVSVLYWYLLLYIILEFIDGGGATLLTGNDMGGGVFLITGWAPGCENGGGGIPVLGGGPIGGGTPGLGGAPNGGLCGVPPGPLGGGGPYVDEGGPDNGADTG